jgi:hypothetical protein
MRASRGTHDIFLFGDWARQGKVRRSAGIARAESRPGYLEPGGYFFAEAPFFAFLSAFGFFFSFFLGLLSPMTSPPYAIALSSMGGIIEGVRWFVQQVAMVPKVGVEPDR